MAQEFMHKNKLQEYAQRCAIALPIYHTINEGSSHAPAFRSTVTVDGTMVTSALAFANKKAAEQHVAKYALECIISNNKKNGIPLIHEDTIFCKSILHEYAVKMNSKLPTYETSQQPGNFPVYSSSVLFDNKTFKGGFAKSKKKAEQIGARTVIEFILGNSDTSTLMTQIIKSKVKLFNTMHKGAGVFASQIQNVVTFAPNTTEISDNLMGSQVSFSCNVPCDVIPPRPLCSDCNTVAADSSLAEATRDQNTTENSDKLMGSQVSFSCNVPCDVIPPRPLCSDCNTVAADSSLAEATRDQNTTENSDKLMGSQVSLSCNTNVPCDVTPPRPLCSDRNTVASDSLPAEATSDQTYKQGSDISSGNTSITLAETVRDGRSANIVSENDSGGFHIQHPVEVTVKVTSDDSPSSCGNSQGHVPDATKKRYGEEQTSNSKLKKARVDAQ